LFLFVCLFLCGGLIVLSGSGALAPVEGVLAGPLNAVSGLFNRIGLSISNTVRDLSRIQDLQKRNADLEEALAELQAELVSLREIGSDYQRLAQLLDYTSTTQDQEFLAADVINIDQSGFLRTIVINRGTRDGIAVGMPVASAQGLVGRVIDVTADAARVQLINDTNSAISARLQTTRAQGSVVGLDSGGLRMTFIPLNATVQEGDIVVTSGLGGNLPPGIVIGVVTSKLRQELDLFQEAEVRSLVDFDTLEIVLVVTSFRPIDLSAFDQQSGQ